MTLWRAGAGSLRLNLMLWVFVPVAAVLGVSLWLSYASASRQATLLTDRQILASARMIAEQIRFRDGAVRVVVPPAALELFATDSHDEVSYAVFDADGALVAGFPGLDLPDPLPAGAEPVTLSTRFRTEDMAAVVLRQPVITPNGTVSVSVMVGETLKARDAMIRSLWLRGFLEQAALVVAVAVFVWIGISRQLQPLLRLRRAVLDKPDDRFEPFDSGAVQVEVRPLVEALNAHMARLAAYLERQRRFLDSAAHQMRTPLAVMKMQVGMARRSAGLGEARAVLDELDTGLTDMSRLARQLLTLGRVEHDRAQLAAEQVDLAAVVREVAGLIAPLALDAGVDLVVEAETPCWVQGSGVLLREAVANLVDNAVAHAGQGAVATLNVAEAGGMGVLTVRDTGRGLAPTDRQKIFQRFQRGSAAVRGGSGLGLAIVAEIAGMFGGRAGLIDLPPGEAGFAVSLALPLVQRTALALSTKASV